MRSGFTNMSGDAEHRYFSDGITEDIITELSRSRSLFVIARNSSFQFRDKDTFTAPNSISTASVPVSSPSINRL